MSDRESRRFVAPDYPLSDTDLMIRSGWSPRLYRRFSRGEFDGVVLLMPKGWKPDIPCRREVVRSERLVLAAPRKPDAPAQVRITAGDLAECTWLLNPDGCGFRQALARAIAETGGQLRVKFELDAAPYEHLAMVAAGVGCSIVPASALTLHPVLAERVQRMSLPHFDAELRVWMLWSDRCQVLDGTREAFASIFTNVEEPRRRRRTVRHAPNATVIAHRHG